MLYKTEKEQRRQIRLQLAAAKMHRERRPCRCCPIEWAEQDAQTCERNAARLQAELAAR